jgi:hypothetical protein
MPLCHIVVFKAFKAQAIRLLVKNRRLESLRAMRPKGSHDAGWRLDRAPVRGQVVLALICSELTQDRGAEREAADPVIVLIIRFHDTAVHDRSICSL